MTSRIRVERALRFAAVDRVPADLNLSYHAYLNLCAALKFPPEPLPKPSLAMEVCPNPRLYTLLGVDVYSIKFGGDATFDGSLANTATDSWGIPYQLVLQPAGALYEVSGHPLASATIADLESYPWPAAPSPAAKAALRETARRIHYTTDLALCGRFGAPIMEVAVGLLGFEEWFVRLAAEPDFVVALLGKIEAVATAWDIAGIEACGEYLSILKVSGEDFGAQQSLLYSPATIRERLLPVLRRRWDAAHRALNAGGSRAKVMLHTCGAVQPIIADLIAAGIDVLDPIQPKAVGMDPAGLYAAFGGRLVFHGGIDVQEVLPRGTPEQVRAHVRAVVAASRAREGGFIAAPSHTVHGDVPAENVLAMLETVKSEEAKHE